jgi:antitoxin VapB
MPILDIKDPVAHELASRLAERTGISLTQAVIQALREQLLRTERPTEPDPEEEYQQMLAHVESLWEPTVDRRTADEIIGYDSNGLPM